MDAYFWEGFKIGLYIAIPLTIIRLIIYFIKGVDINPFSIRKLLQFLITCLAITFSFVKDDDFKK